MRELIGNQTGCEKTNDLIRRSGLHSIFFDFEAVFIQIFLNDSNKEFGSGLMD